MATPTARTPSPPASPASPSPPHAVVASVSGPSMQPMWASASSWSVQRSASTVARRPAGPPLSRVRRLWQRMRASEAHILLRLFMVVSLGVIAALAVAAMVVVSRGLEQSYQDTLTLFVGGFVFGLTESGLVDCYRILASPNNATEVQAAALDLSLMKTGLTVGLTLLQYGNASTSPALTSPTTSPAIVAKLQQIVGPANITVAAIDTIQVAVLVNGTTSLTPAVAAAVQTIMALGPLLLVEVQQLLVLMTQATLDYVTAVQQQVYVFMGIILAVLLLEATLVYWPLERRIKHVTRALETRNADLLHLTKELAVIMQLSPNGIFRASPEGHVTYANSRWHQLTGLPAGAKQSWLTAVFPDDRPAVEEQWTRALREPAASMALEFRLQRSDADGASQIRWVLSECRHDTTIGPSGVAVVRSIVGSFTDVTEHKQMEQERLELLQHATATAEEHRREQQVFVDTICHGIRNPLNGIFNNADLLRESLEKRRESGDTPAIAANDAASIDAIATCANYQRVITDDVLNFSRLKANKVVLHLTDFRLGALLRTSIIMYAAEARAEDVDLTVEADAGVLDLVVRHDRERLSQILANLLSNAIKFTRSSVERRVVLRAAVSPPPPCPVNAVVALTLAVVDTGIGIARADQPLLFHRFGQVGGASSRTYVGGSGLGLSICKLLVDLMGGTIFVQSELGRGTEFSLTVPCEAVAVEAEQEPRPDAPVATGEGRPMRLLSVLIAEDNLINQSVLRRQLEMSSKEAGVTYDTVIANNGQEAVDLTEQHAFDVVLMDIQMPLLDGIEATRALRGRGHTMPIIGLSGNARQEQIDAAIAAGMQGYLIKPYNRKELVALINRQCGLGGP